jgi:hypothetical protein
MDHPAPHASPGHEGRVTSRPVVATGIRAIADPRSSPELTDNHYQGFIEQSSGLQIFQSR